MSDFALVETLLNDLLNASASEFTDFERHEVQSYIDVGEYGLALETIADIYADFQKIPSPNVMSQIRKLAAVMSMNPGALLERLSKR